MIELLLEQFSAGSRTPAVAEEITTAEHALGFALPDRLKALYANSNGLVIDRHRLVLMDLAAAVNHAQAIADVEIVNHLGMLPLTESNDSNPYCVCCKSPLVGRIIHLRHDDAPQLAFRNIDEFAAAINSLASSNDWMIHDIAFGYTKDHSDRTRDDDIAADLLLSEVCDDIENVCSFAISLYSKSRLNSIIEFLEHESMWVREDAAVQLGEIGDVDAMEPLRRLASAGNRQDNRAAAQALERLMNIKR